MMLEEERNLLCEMAELLDPHTEHLAVIKMLSKIQC